MIYEIPTHLEGVRIEVRWHGDLGKLISIHGIERSDIGTAEELASLWPYVGLAKRTRNPGPEPDWPLDIFESELHAAVRRLRTDGVQGKLKDITMWAEIDEIRPISNRTFRRRKREYVTKYEKWPNQPGSLANE